MADPLFADQDIRVRSRSAFWPRPWPHPCTGHSFVVCITAPKTTKHPRLSFFVLPGEGRGALNRIACCLSMGGGGIFFEKPSAVFLVYSLEFLFSVPEHFFSPPPLNTTYGTLKYRILSFFCNFGKMPEPKPQRAALNRIACSLSMGRGGIFFGGISPRVSNFY